jgi:hypothetical protein
MKRILLIHLGANGDCVMATTIARQIKVDYPGCHLTWCIGDRYASVLVNNPDVDAIWAFELKNGEPVAPDAWYRCWAEAVKRKEAGDFDLIFNTQVFPDNISNFDGTTRSSTFRNYPHPITVPVTPVIRLAPEEVSHVQTFVEAHRLGAYKHVILVECSPGSGQSAFSFESGLEMARRLTMMRRDVVVVISTHIPFVPPHERIIPGHSLSYRENAGLTHHCTLLAGCSSGISWISTSSASKRLQTVQFISRNLAAAFSSMVYDFKYWGLPIEHIIENTTTQVDCMVSIVCSALEDFKGARIKYHQDLTPIFWSWLCCVNHRKGFYGIIRSYRPMIYYIQRNGLSVKELFAFNSLFWVIRVAFGVFFKKHNSHQ